MKRQIRIIPLLAMALCFGGTLAHAQDASIYFGGGYATDSSANSVSYLLTPNGLVSPKLNASFGKIGGDFMLTKHYGIGFESDFQFSRSNYQGFTTRPVFYDFNGIYMPFTGRYTRIAPEIQAGLGGERMTFTYSQTYCDTLVGCTSQSTPYEAASHFQVHVGVGVRLYATRHVFIKPYFDYHYVTNFIQYGRGSVPEFGAAVGWSFAGR